MSPQVKKYLFFAAAFGVWLMLDLWSKDWADTYLAASVHPLPVHVDEADAGKPLGQVVGDYFDISAEEAEADLFPQVRRLAPAAAVTRDDAVFGERRAPRSLDVFWRGPEAPPRTVHLNERAFVGQWLALAVTDAHLAPVREGADAYVAAITFGELLTERIHGMSDDDIDAVLAASTHPVSGGQAFFGPHYEVKAGEVFLVTQREIGVMGDWFKLLYAENPGAAFGFLRGLEEGVRKVVFILLTLLAFVVILTITVRMPAEARFIHLALGGILAGAAGNFVDRLRFGYVIDFIDMDLGFMHWPTYNVADIAIVVGVFMLVIDMLFNKQSPLVKQKDEDEGEDETQGKKKKKTKGGGNKKKKKKGKKAKASA